MQVWCQFCREIKLNKIDAQDIIIDDCILRENKYFVLTLNIWTFNVWYTLLLPKRHIPWFSYLTRDEWDSFYEFQNTILPTIHRIFWPLVLFEHGWATSDLWCSCIQHAHLHIVPYDSNIVKFQSIWWEKLCSLEELTIYSIIEKPYLLYIYENKIFTKKCDFDCSQFFRKYIISQMWIEWEIWNRRKYQFKENMIQTKDILKNSL